MNLKAGLAFVLFVLSVSFAPAQTLTPKQVDEINLKIAKLDLLIKLVPLALTKDQYPDLLTGIENAREVERQMYKDEQADLASLDPALSDTVQAAVEKGAYPPRAEQDQVQKVLRGIQGRRLAMKEKALKLVYNAIRSKLNDGQIKVMVGSFDDRFVDPKSKPGDLGSEVKINFFINDVFLDPLCYDLLLDMSKHAS